MTGNKGNGAAIWGSISANAKGNKLFVATGDGDNPFQQPLTYAFVAVNPNTPKAVDHWQVPANVAIADNDFGTTPTVFKSGKRTLVGAGVKTGLYYVLDTTHLKKGPIWRKGLGNSGFNASFRDDIVSSAYASGKAYPGGAALFVAAPAVSGSGTHTVRCSH